MPSDPQNDPNQILYRSLTDPSRKSPRGDYRFAYTEEQFERRLRDEHKLVLFEETWLTRPLLEERLILEQSEELLNGLGLQPRQVRICRLRLEGYTTREIAAELQLSERRVWSLLSDLKKILQIRLKEETGEESAVNDPYYGWQEVFLQSQKL